MLNRNVLKVMVLSLLVLGAVNIVMAGTITSLSPTSGAAGVQVTISGSDFGSAQGAGAVWLGSTYGTVVSWSDTEVVATVASNATSGTAQVQQGGAWSNAVTFNVSTAAISTVTPSSGVAETQVTIAGSGFGAAQGSGQVWLGSASGVVQSWSDTQVVALVATGSTSGNARVLRNGVWSNAVSFTVTTLRITSVSPVSGGSETSVTITGTSFGSSQGTGAVLLGSTAGQVVSWNDTQVVATVASTALTGVVRIQQNGVWSNAVSFTVPSGGNAVTLVPNIINLTVGDTRTIQALNEAGQPVTGLTWTSSDSNVVSLSSADPPVLTALAAGHVTITAGTASADVTVLAGALPVGTVVWSNPGSGSGVYSIVPAVPSPTGVADVFAFQNDGTVQAITSEGATAWTADVSQAWPVVPDFQGGLVGVEWSTDNGSIVKIDGTTGQRSTLYTQAETGWLDGSVVGVHTDGTIFAIQYTNDRENGSDAVIGIDPTTGTQKFAVPIGGSMDSRVGAGVSGSRLIIAGDGYAYVPHAYQEPLNDAPDFHCQVHVGLLRIDSSGAYNDFAIHDWTGGCAELFSMEVNTITNADTGILLSWWENVDNAGGLYSMAITTGTSVSLVSAPGVPGQVEPVVPMLQAQDGSFVGSVWDESDNYHMVAFDQSGNVRWSVPNYYPQIATDDGGVIATADDGSAVTFDQNGGATGQMASLTQSWKGDAYQIGSIEQVVRNWLRIAQSFWPFAGANASGNNTAAQQPWYAPLRSCPGASTPCPQEAISSALSALKTLLQSPCSLCTSYVFSKLPGTDQTSFFNFLSRPARLFDGTRSYAPAHVALCPSGVLNQLFCGLGNEAVHAYMERMESDAVAQTPSDEGKGMQIFFNPAEGVCNALSLSNPQSGDKGVLNQATLFHEALHGYAGLVDYQLQNLLGTGYGGSVSITYYLRNNVIPGGRKAQMYAEIETSIGLADHPICDCRDPFAGRIPNPPSSRIGRNPRRQADLSGIECPCSSVQATELNGAGSDMESKTAVSTWI